MKKLFIIPLLFLSLTGAASCTHDDTPVSGTEQPAAPENPGDEEKPDEPNDPGPSR